ncbi:MAG: glutamate--tRNA ligase family protein, partial [Candidatus Omnitrophota bacterium]
GFLHIGGLRTCLYNYLFARKNKGKLILRIEDTDRERYVEGAIEGLIRTLQAVGLDWDEGPLLLKGQKIFQFSISNFHINSKFKIQNFKFKGKFGPYIQSQRLDIYQNLAQKLVDNGQAYYCFCTSEDLEKMRQEQIAKKIPPHYDERCRHLSEERIASNLRSGQAYVIRLKVPEKGNIKI